jgi:tetratricopeptide (TPR) repeat protein
MGSSPNFLRSCVLGAFWLQCGLLCLAGPPEDAEAHLKAGRAKEAETIYNQLLQGKPDNFTWLFSRGKARQALGDKQGAAADYENALRLSPDNGAIYSQRGNFRENVLHDNEGAVADYTQLLRLLPDEPYYFWRARAKYKAGHLSESLADLAVSLTKRPDYGPAYFHRGVILEKLGRDQEALAAYRKAVELEPRNASAKKVLDALEAALKSGAPRPAPVVDKISPVEVPATPGPQAMKRRVFKLVKAEVPIAGFPKGWENFNYKPSFETVGRSARFKVRNDWNGQTQISEVSWTVPEELIPGQPAHFHIEGPSTNNLLTYSYITMRPPRGGEHPLAAIRITHNALSGVDVARADFDLRLPDITRAPEDNAAGLGGRPTLIRWPNLQQMSNIVEDLPGTRPDSPASVSLEETSFPLRDWLRGDSKELADLEFRVFWSSSRWPVARYVYRCVETLSEGIELVTDPSTTGGILPDGVDGIFVKARAKARSNGKAPTPEATANITFSALGEGAPWADFTKAELRDGWKVVFLKASNPDSVRGSSKPPNALTICAESRDGDSQIGGVLPIKIAATPTIEVDRDIFEFTARTGATLPFKAWVESAGNQSWQFRADYAPKQRAVATVTLRPTGNRSADLQLQEAGLEPETGGSTNEVSVLRIFAEQAGRPPLERDLKVAIAQEGLYATSVGRDPQGNFYRVAADGKATPRDVDFRVMIYDPVQKKLVNDKEAVARLTITCLEDEGSIPMQVMKTGQLKWSYAGPRASNNPTGIYRFSMPKEIPGDGRIIKCDFKATLAGRTGETFAAIFTLGFVTTNDGPGSADWALEVSRCEEIIRKFVPAAHYPKMMGILEKHKRTLGVEGLKALRGRIWRSATELTLGEGGQGYANEAAWANYIATTLEWAEWAGDMAFGAVMGATTGPYGATGAGMLKSAVISAIHAYQDGQSADAWLWENLCTIPGLLEGKVIDPAMFEKLGLTSKAKAWSVYVAYHFCKNLYAGASLVDALKNTGREVGNNLLASWLNEKVKASVAGAPPPPAGVESDASRRISKGMAMRDGKAFASQEDVLAIMRDPSQVRALKNASREVQEAFHNTREAIYRQHDQSLVTFVKSNQPELKGRVVRVLEFRTPGQDGRSLNTDRDYRVCYLHQDSKTGKESWIEVDRRKWENHSYQTFARLTGGPSDEVAAREWAAQHQQLATDKSHLEASPAFTDQAKVWNAQTRQFEAVQVVPNIVAVKSGQAGVSLKDPQALGRMYQVKVADAKFKHEAFVQAQKAVNELSALRQGYEAQQRDVGNLPAPLAEAMKVVIKANQALAADPNRRNPKALAAAEKTLQEHGFQSLGDFMDKLGGQFESLKFAKAK